MRRIYLLVIGLICGMVISGFFCSSVSKSGQQGDQFYAYLKNGDHQKILELLDREALKAHTGEEWIQILESHADEWGNLVSYTNTGFHTETIDGKSIAKLDYTVNTTNGINYEKIEFVKRGSEYKILTYEFDKDKEKFVSNE